MDLAEVLIAWDNMDNAAQRIATAQPFQMTEAASRLEDCRLAMRKTMQDFAYSQYRRDMVRRDNDLMDEIDAMMENEE